MRTALLGLVLTVLLTGCAGNTVVDFRADMAVSYRDSEGREMDMAPERTVEMPLDNHRLVAFPGVFYRDRLLSWKSSVGTFMIRNEIENVSAKHLTLHWEEAQLSSSQLSRGVPLRSYMSFVGGKWLGPKGYVPNPDDILHPLVPLHLRPGEKSEASFGALYAELFRSGQLFGARYEPGRTRLLENGVGEWLLITLPIEHGEKRLTMQIKLTALDAKARISYY